MEIQWKLTDMLCIKSGVRTWEFNIGDIVSFVIEKNRLFFRIEEFFVMGKNIIMIGVYWDNEKNVQKNMPYIRIVSVTCPCNYCLYVPVEEMTHVHKVAPEVTPCASDISPTAPEVPPCASEIPPSAPEEIWNAPFLGDYPRPSHASLKTSTDAPSRKSARKANA